MLTRSIGSTLRARPFFRCTKFVALAQTSSVRTSFSSVAEKKEVLENFEGIGRLGKTFVHPGESEYWSETPYHQTQEPIEKAWTLTPKAYYDREFAKVESSNIFTKDWVCVAHTSQLSRPGDMMSVDFAGKSILLTRSKSGKLNAFYNSCRHRGTKLVDCIQNKKQISCPYHYWVYSLEGDLVSAPQFPDSERKRGKRKGLDFDLEKFHLIPVHVDTWGFLVFVNLDENPDPLSKQLGDLPDTCKNYPLENYDVLKTKVYKPECNWKLLCENFMEWYHLTAVHPALCNFSVPDNHENLDAGDNYVSFRTYPLKDGGGPADTDVFNFVNGINEDEQKQLMFYHIYPNVSISLYTHSAYTLIMLPDGKDPEKTTEHLSLLMPPESRIETDTDEVHSQKIDGLMDFVCMVNDEDVDICEKVQEGVRNDAYPGGRFAHVLEKHVYDYQQMIIRGMTRQKPAHLARDSGVNGTPVQ